MKPFLAFFASLLIAVAALGQNGPVQNHSFLGATEARTSGLNSTNYLDGIIPSATITVYLTGTQTLATIFTNSGGTPLANPFTSNTLGSVNPGGWIFWAATNQGYDVVMSGGISPNTYAQPVSLIDIFPGAAGGGGGGSCTGSATQITYFSATNVCSGDTYFTDTAPSTSGTGELSYTGNGASFATNQGGTYSFAASSTTTLSTPDLFSVALADSGSNSSASIFSVALSSNGSNSSNFSVATNPGAADDSGNIELTTGQGGSGGNDSNNIELTAANEGAGTDSGDVEMFAAGTGSGSGGIEMFADGALEAFSASVLLSPSGAITLDTANLILPGISSGTCAFSLAVDSGNNVIQQACGGSTSPLTTKGDIYTFSSVGARLPVGTNGQVLSANSAQTTGLQWISAFTNPMTTLGDTVYGGAAGAVTRLTGSTSASTLCLTQTGTGSVSAAPVWGSCAGSATTALSSITAASTNNTAASGNNPIVWNWAQTSNTQTAFTFGETSAATGTSDQELAVTAVTGSTAVPLTVTDSLNSAQTIAALQILPTWNTSGVVDAALLVNVTNTASGAASKLFDLKVGGTSEMAVDDAGIITNATWAGVAIANAYLANSSTTVNGQVCTLGSTCTVASTKTAITHEWLNSFTSTTGLFTATQPAFTDISGQATNAQLATLGANQVLGALTATTPTGLAVPSCSGAANALTWTSGTGFGCNTITGGGTAPTIQTNTVNNTTQTLLNFTNPAAFNGLSFTFSNPSGGIETFGVTGTLTNAGLSNSTITLGSTSVALGATITSATGFNAATATNLASYPTLCTGLTFSKGLSSGSNNCSTPAGGGNVSTSGTTTTGFYPVFNGTTTITNGHLDDGVTTASTVTSSEAFAAPSMKVGSGSGTTIVSGSGVPTGCGSTYANGSLYLNLTGTAGVTFGTGSLLYSCNGGTTTWNNII